jgi:Domain of unknown function (DUF4386)
LNAFTTEQSQAAAYWSIQLFEGGFAISLVFFGFDCLTMAYLIVRSTFFPRLIGVLLAIEGAGYLINSFALFLAPALPGEPLRAKSVTYVSGTFCYLCLRNGHFKDGCGGWI